MADTESPAIPAFDSEEATRLRAKIIKGETITDEERREYIAISLASRSALETHECQTCPSRERKACTERLTDMAEVHEHVIAGHLLHLRYAGIILPIPPNAWLLDTLMRAGIVSGSEIDRRTYVLLHALVEILGDDGDEEEDDEPNNIAQFSRQAGTA